MGSQDSKKRVRMYYRKAAVKLRPMRQQDLANSTYKPGPQHPDILLTSPNFWSTSVEAETSDNTWADEPTVAAGSFFCSKHHADQAQQPLTANYAVSTQIGPQSQLPAHKHLDDASGSCPDLSRAGADYCGIDENWFALHQRLVGKPGTHPQG